MKSKTKNKEKVKRGQKALYDVKYNQIVYVACKEGGLTDVKLAKLFGICRATLSKWKVRYPEFKAMMVKGKDEFDTENVEKDLLKNARGFKYKETTSELKLVEIRNKKGEIIGAEEKLVVTKVVTKLKAGSTTAQIYWLKNRDQARWRDRIDIDFNDLTLKRVKKRYDGEEVGDDD